MPAWMTPLEWPLWWTASPSSRSRTTTSESGWRRFSSRAVAIPTIPPPTTQTSQLGGGEPVIPSTVCRLRPPALVQSWRGRAEPQVAPQPRRIVRARDRRGDPGADRRLPPLRAPGAVPTRQPRRSRPDSARGRAHPARDRAADRRRDRRFRVRGARQRSSVHRVDRRLRARHTAREGRLHRGRQGDRHEARRPDPEHAAAQPHRRNRARGEGPRRARPAARQGRRPEGDNRRQGGDPRQRDHDHAAELGPRGGRARDRPADPRRPAARRLRCGRAGAPNCSAAGRDRDCRGRRPRADRDPRRTLARPRADR